jgi:hypothetical protein
MSSSKIRMRITHCTSATHSLLTSSHRTLPHRLILSKTQILLSKSTFTPFWTNSNRSSCQPFGSRIRIRTLFHTSTHRTYHGRCFGTPRYRTRLTHHVLHRRTALNDVITVVHAHDALHFYILKNGFIRLQFLIPKPPSRVRSL